MIPDENGEKYQQYQRTALDGVGFGNVLATSQPRAMQSAASGGAVTSARGGLTAGCCTARLGRARVIEII
jgi:hypothetical protein